MICNFQSSVNTKPFKDDFGSPMNLTESTSDHGERTPSVSNIRVEGGVRIIDGGGSPQVTVLVTLVQKILKLN